MTNHLVKLHSTKVDKQNTMLVLFVHWHKSWTTGTIKDKWRWNSYCRLFGIELMSHATCTNKIKLMIIKVEKMLANTAKALRICEINLKLNCCVILVLINGAESWTNSKVLEGKLDTCEMKWLRRMMKISYKEQMTKTNKNQGQLKEVVVTSTAA